MPNKRRTAKLATKMLISGKMKSNKDVQETMKFIKQKQQEDKEDINFDVIESFGKSLPTKIPKLKKRKAAKQTDEMEQSSAKKAKIEGNSSEKEQKSSNSNALPKKSIKQFLCRSLQRSKDFNKFYIFKGQKNKYYFIAHPEELKKKNKILVDQDESKFIIDSEKIKLNEVKKSKNMKLKKNGKSEEKSSKAKDANAAGKKSLKKGKNKIWTIEACSSESETSDQETSTLQANNKTISLELNDIDKSFKIKKSLEKQKDGSFIEVIRPEFFKDDDDEEEEDDDNEASDNQSEPEIEDQEESHANKKSKVETSKNGTSSNSNPLMEKLKSSRFRYLNELLYTHPSAYSFEFFEK